MLGPSAPFGDPPELLIRGFAFFQVLVAACKFDLFTFLSTHPHSSRMDIAKQLEIPDQSTEVLLLACASLGLIKVNAKDGTYCNSWMTERRFVAHSHKNELASIDAFHNILYKPLFHLTESLKKGTNAGLSSVPGQGDTLYERLSSTPALEQSFYGWMENLDSGEIPRSILDAMKGSKNLLDVGGGSAKIAIGLVSQLKNLSVTIFDLPTSCKLAEERVEEAGKSERISFVAGNFIEDPFQGNFDTILFAHIFNIYSEDTNQRLVQKCAEALPKGGKLVIFNIVSDDNGTGPLDAAFLSLYFLGLATGEGMVYPPKRYENWFRRAGFESLMIETETYQGIFVGTK